jgi:hypothetical protein
MKLTKGELLSHHSKSTWCQLKSRNAIKIVFKTSIMDNNSMMVDILCKALILPDLIKMFSQTLNTKGDEGMILDRSCLKPHLCRSMACTMDSIS